MPIQQYKIAAGWDNEAGFENIETIVPAGSSPRPVFYNAGTPTYYYVRGWDSLSRGQRRFDAVGGSSFSGFSIVEWQIAVVDALGRQHMIDNYEGQVTVATTVGKPDVYENWNAYLEVPDPSEVSSRDKMLTEFLLRFRLVSST